ncbi:MAG: primosomal protein N' [Bacteroidetes bacterium]|nr:primosomal protein N' [Bacteroidota bacterium]
MTDYTILYIRVLLPLALRNEYTYRVPQELNELVDVGKRVVVQFGKRKIYTGLVLSVGEESPAEYDSKYILSVLDDVPVVSETQFKFWRWISSYYLCSLGEVMNAALPAAMKLESESKVSLKDGVDTQNVELDLGEQAIVHLLEDSGGMSLNELDKITGKKSNFRYIKSLYEKGLISIREELLERYVPKFVTYVSFRNEFAEHSNRKDLFNELENKYPLQLEVLLRLISADPGNEGVDRNQFIKQFKLSKSSVKTLVKNQILKEENRVVDRVRFDLDDELKENHLTGDQAEVYAKMNELFPEEKPVLLQGITSSGKTHVYIQLIEDAIKNGRQVLYLLPEISLTTQLIHRIQSYFGDLVAINHSRFSDEERQEIWDKVFRNEVKILLTPRSGIFMPLHDIGLIIVDEEHEQAFKQSEPNPRYHARDLSIVLAGLYKAHLVLGSATPSVETQFNARHGKYGRVVLENRFKGVALPGFELVDMRQERLQKKNSGVFSSVLVDALKKTFEQGEQAILFQNRKGYVPITECPECSWTPRCVNCDITLTYYRFEDRLKCHFCGYSTPPVTECKACGSPVLNISGYGTERIEHELLDLFPDIRVHRVDQESTRKKHALENIIRKFENRETDVLIGTQMIAKGLDFDHLKLVGIIDADHALNFPDFRAFERSFQLFTQVAGRAGRRSDPGTVIVQTNQPEHPVLASVVQHDYETFYQSEIQERSKFQYPPFSRLIRITLKHKDKAIVHQASQHLGMMMKQRLGDFLLGPLEPYVSRIRGLFLRQMIVKIVSPLPLNGTKQFVDQCVQLTKGERSFSTVRIIVDVDPY